MEKSQSTKNYHLSTGIWKWVKNFLVIVGPPLVLYVINNYTQFVPQKYMHIAVIIASAISYIIKNRVEFKNRNPDEGESKNVTSE